MRPFSWTERRLGANMAMSTLTAVLAIASLTWRTSANVVKKASGKTAADYFVTSLPGAPDGPLLKMHAGHIEVSPEHHGNLFFWHFANRHLADKPRTVIWLNGGPGCSSEDGVLMEIGPYRVREGGKLVYNEGSWDEFANVLFIDNPVGTGFSYVDTDSYLHELKDMADQFILFLEKFFAILPEYAHDDLYIAGESYAGTYIPYIARAILDRNKVNPATMHLKGVLIGNGWTSPTDQYLSYLPFAYKSGLVQGNTDIARTLEAQQAVCVQRLNADGKNHVDTSECEDIMQKILDLTQDRNKPITEQCVNMYDVRLRDSFPSCGMNWPPDLKDVTTYLRRPDVVAALHVDADKKTGWTECSGAVGGAFRARNSRPAIDLLPGLLSEIQVVLFSGDQDLICNHLGTEEMINNMQWNGGKGFEVSPGAWAPRRAWTFEGEAAGIYQEARNLTYILFYNSSHMVPFDYPRRTRDMLDRFIGVDIASIGGKPADSRIDGEKGPQTSVVGNSTAAEAETQKAVTEAVHNAYYRSGEVVLILVIIAAGVWGWFVWRDRKKRSGYQGLLPIVKNRRHGAGAGSIGGRENVRDGLGLNTFRPRKGKDVEAADFDENELADLESESEGEGHKENGAFKGGKERRHDVASQERYSIGGESDSEEEGVEKGRR